MTRLGNLLDFGQLLKHLSTINLPKSPHILRQFLQRCQNLSFFYWNLFWATFIDIWWFLSSHTDHKLPSGSNRSTKWVTAKICSLYNQKNDKYLSSPLAVDPKNIFLMSLVHRIPFITVIYYRNVQFYITWTRLRN